MCVFYCRITNLPDPNIVITVEENDTNPFRCNEQELWDLLTEQPDKGDILQDLQDSDDLKSLGRAGRAEKQ